MCRWESSDGREVFKYGSNPIDNDTDGDMLLIGMNILMVGMKLTVTGLRIDRLELSGKKLVKIIGSL